MGFLKTVTAKINTLTLSIGGDREQVLNQLKRVCGTSNFKTTTHMQYGGEYEGETLTKLYHAGSPSYLAMLREDGSLISLKRDAITVFSI